MGLGCIKLTADSGRLWDPEGRREQRRKDHTENLPATNTDYYKVISNKMEQRVEDAIKTSFRPLMPRASGRGFGQSVHGDT